LHTPCVVTVDEPGDAFVAIVLSDGVAIVDRFALRKNAILRGPHIPVLASEEEENQVGLLGWMRPIVVGNLRGSDDVSKPPPVKACDFTVIQQVVLQNVLQNSRDFVFACVFESKTFWRVCAKDLEC